MSIKLEVPVALMERSYQCDITKVEEAVRLMETFGDYSEELWEYVGENSHGEDADLTEIVQVHVSVRERMRVGIIPREGFKPTYKKLSELYGLMERHGLDAPEVAAYIREYGMDVTENLQGLAGLLEKLVVRYGAEAPVIENFIALHQPTEGNDLEACLERVFAVREAAKDGELYIPFDL